MNFLQICQKVQEKSGIQTKIGSVSTPGLGTIETDIIQSVVTAWSDIQTMREDWKFMRSEVDLTLTTATTTHTVSSIFSDEDVFASWKEDRFLYLFTVLQYIPYDRFILIDFTTTSEPKTFTINPSNNDLIFNPVDTSYDITLQYYINIQTLADNTDIPNLPSRFHHLLVYAALLDVTASIGDLISYQRYSLKYSMMVSQLMRSELPGKSVRIQPIA